MQSDMYVKIHYQTIDTIRVQNFTKFYKNLEKIMVVIEGHKF